MKWPSDDTKLKVCDALGILSFILTTISVPCRFILLSETVAEVSYFTGLCFCKQKMLHVKRNCFLSRFYALNSIISFTIATVAR